jgi:hypothetical protein
MTNLVPMIVGPGKKSFHAIAFAPHDAEKFSCPEVVHIATKQCLKAPANQRARPRTEPIAFSQRPVGAESVQHL